MQSYKIEQQCYKCKGTGRASKSKGCSLIIISIFLSVLVSAIALEVIKKVFADVLANKHIIVMFYSSFFVVTIFISLILKKFDKCEVCHGKGKVINTITKI